LRRRIDDYMDSQARRAGRRHHSAGEPCPPNDDVRKAVEVAVQEAVRALAEEIRSLREEVARLRAEIARLQVQSRKPQAGAKGRSRLAEKLVEVLAEEGYILASESKNKLGLGPYRLKELAMQTGSRVLTLEGDLAVVDPEAYREFLMLLASARTSDPGEAAKRMGKYRKLFEKLRASSMVYYDAKRGSWRLLE